MHKKAGTFFLLGAIVFSGCRKTENYSEPEIIAPKKKYAAFSSEAEKYLLSQKFSGSVLVAKKDRIIFAKGFGSSDIKNPASLKNSPGTVFEAGSITKQMTAAAILKLEKQHKLSQNDTIEGYFPQYPHAKEITIKMLLNMRSGLTDHINSGAEFFPREIYRELEKNQIACQSVDRNIVLTYLPSAPLLAKPDSTYFYCNTNYYLLAHIIEQETKKPFHEYMKKHILKKCRMKKSNFDFQNTDARGYTRGLYYSIPEGLSLGSGDLNSCVIDLFKWNRAFVKGKVIPKKYIRQLKKARGYNYGLNCGKHQIFHAGNTNVFNSYNSYNFKNGISVIVMSNRPMNECNATAIAGRLSKIAQEKL